MRSHYCGDINRSDIGSNIEISGWVHKRRDHGGVIFLDIRDLHGIVQVVFNPDFKEVFDKADSCRSEFVVNIQGLVRERIDGAINTKMATGEIELEAKSLNIFSSAVTPKFPLDDYQDVNEDIRLKNRFVDLRRPDVNQRLVKRSKITSKIRSFLEKNNFNEWSIVQKNKKKGIDTSLIKSGQAKRLAKNKRRGAPLPMFVEVIVTRKGIPYSNIDDAFTLDTACKTPMFHWLQERHEEDELSDFESDQSDQSPTAAKRRVIVKHFNGEIQIHKSVSE